MPVTVAPSTEAMDAIVSRITTGGAYSQPASVSYGELRNEDLIDVTTTLVDVVSDDEEQLAETIDSEDRTTHTIRVWIRRKVNDLSNGTINPLKLMVRQLFQRLNNFRSNDNRVTVWAIDYDPKEMPDKQRLKLEGLFIANLTLRVEVEAS